MPLAVLNRHTLPTDDPAPWHALKWLEWEACDKLESSCTRTHAVMEVSRCQII